MYCTAQPKVAHVRKHEKPQVFRKRVHLWSSH